MSTQQPIQTNTNRVARCDVTNELLAQFLKLPEGMRIVRAAESPELHDAIQIVVEDERLPVVAKGERIPSIEIMFKNREGVVACIGWKTERGEFVPAHLRGEELKRHMADRVHPRETEHA